MKKKIAGSGQRRLVLVRVFFFICNVNKKTFYILKDVHETTTCFEQFSYPKRDCE